MTKAKMLLSMLIFGTIGIFVEMIPLPSSVIALARSGIGAALLALVMLEAKKPLHRDAIRQNLKFLLPSGAALGFNWILLFEAYRYTTVAVATLCYYMAPVFVILLSPVFLKEALSKKKLLCVAAALAGTALISGASASAGGGELRGVALGLCAALLYCAIVLLNRGVKDLPATETTLCQLTVSALVMLPYVLLTQKGAALDFSGRTLLLVLLLGFVHTGLAYLLFFGAAAKLPAQTTAVLSYVDPVTAIVLSALLLNQPLRPLQIFGAFLILGSTLAGDLLTDRPPKPQPIKK